MIRNCRDGNVYGLGGEYDGVGIVVCLCGGVRGRGGVCVGVCVCVCVCV